MDFLDSLKEIKQDLELANKEKEEQRKIKEKEAQLQKEFIDFMNEQDVKQI